MAKKRIRKPKVTKPAPSTVKDWIGHKFVDQGGNVTGEIVAVAFTGTAAAFTIRRPDGREDIIPFCGT